jgi:hypothetical protein
MDLVSLSRPQILFFSVSSGWSIPNPDATLTPSKDLFMIYCTWKRSALEPPRMILYSANPIFSANRQYVLVKQRYSLYLDSNSLQNDISFLGSALRQASRNRTNSAILGVLSHFLIARILEFVSFNTSVCLLLCNKRLFYGGRHYSSLWWRQQAISMSQIYNYEVKAIIRRNMKKIVISADGRVDYNDNSSGYAYNSFVTACRARIQFGSRIKLLSSMRLFLQHLISSQSVKESSMWVFPKQQDIERMNLKWANLALGTPGEEHVMLKAIMDEIELQAPQFEKHFHSSCKVCLCPWCKLKSIYQKAEDLFLKRENINSQIVKCLSQAKNFLTDDEIVTLAAALHQSKLMLTQNMQYRFDFQTTKTTCRSQGKEGFWYTAVLQDIPHENLGDLNEIALSVFFKMQTVDRLIVYNLLGLVNNTDNGDSKPQFRRKKCLEFLPAITASHECSSSSQHHNPSIFPLYKRHKIELSPNTCLLENFRNSGAPSSEIHIEFAPKTIFINVVTDPSQKLKAIISQAYESVHGKPISYHKEITVCQVTVEPMSKTEHPATWQLQKFEKCLLNLDVSVQDSNLDSGDCLVVNLGGDES